MALLGVATLVFAACAPQAKPKPRPKPATPPPARTSSGTSSDPEVSRFLAGTWLRATPEHSEGFRLHADGTLELVRIAPLQGVSWRIEGRRLFLRMRGVRDGDLYEDELYLRRLTDRSLVVDAEDSHFRGAYERYRTASAPSPSPTPVAAVAAGRDLNEPIRLQPIDPQTLEGHSAWSVAVADLANCGETLNRSVCPRFYSDAGRTTLLIEVCQGNRTVPSGIHLYDDLGFRSSYPWFDSGYGRFVCENSCDDPGACVYDVTALESLGRPTEMVHRFSYAGVAGWVRLRLGADGSIRGTERKIYSGGR